LQGTYPNPTIKPSALPWSVSGATLTPTDATKFIAAASSRYTGFQWGPRSGGTILSRLVRGGTVDGTYLTLNATIEPTGTAWTFDDTTKPSWTCTLRGDTDNFIVARGAPNVAPTSLFTLDNVGKLSLPGDANYANVMLGASTIRTRLQHSNTAAITMLSHNRDFANSSAQDDGTKPSWSFLLRADNDTCNVQRSPAGSTTQTNLLFVDNAGNLTAIGSLALNPPTGAVQASAYGYGTSGGAFKGVQARGTPGAITPSQTGDVLGLFSGIGCASAGSNTGDQGIIRFLATENWSATARGTRVDVFLTNNGSTTLVNTHQFNQNGDITITGNNATKNTGTTWINPSDPRLKQDGAPYAAGLAEIAQLEPITYRLKAQPDRLCYGFDAAQVRDVFPECVTETSMKLDPADEEETDGVLTFDMHPILVALVNAVKELTARVSALEGPAA